MIDPMAGRRLIVQIFCSIISRDIRKYINRVACPYCRSEITASGLDIVKPRRKIVCP